MKLTELIKLIRYSNRRVLYQLSQLYYLFNAKKDN